MISIGYSQREALKKRFTRPFKKKRITPYRISRNIFYLSRAMATEQQIQSKKIKQLESEGYYVIKIIKANKNGLPDILALHPIKGILFCEVKTEKGVLSELQKFRLKELQQYGFDVQVLRGDRISSDFI